MKTVFIVDDNKSNLYSAKTALEGFYKTYALTSAERMFKIAERITPDLILLDIEMPGTDGFEAMRILKSDPRRKEIPVVFLTSRNDAEAEIRGFEMGALDFIIKPISPPVLVRRIETHLETDKLIKKSQKDLRDIHNATISVIANFIDSRDEITGGHVERTQIYLELLVKEIIRTGTYKTEMSEWDISSLLPSAQLHDVGKIKISDAILNKRGKLTAEEFESIKSHCQMGERVISRIIERTNNDVFLRHAKRFAGYHHEKWDGTGYPRGLRGEEIPLEGRIMAIADVYDALVSERPYKEPFSHEKAVEIIYGESGRHFDPKLTEAFLNIADEFRARLTPVENQGGEVVYR
ncbi:MAG: response regulator [Oscillospiraceae bacterium]|nr:response regulator [Oscillospiraceae bacterium]